MFFKCLRADLQRLSAPGVTATGLRLWLRIFHPRCVPVVIIRLSASCYRYRLLRPMAQGLSILNLVLFGLEVTPRCSIGEGLFLPHTVGTVIGAAVIGRNATIFQGVTLGATEADIKYNPARRPRLGDDVLIGAGAKVLGGILVGDRVMVAANSLVLTDVRDGARVLGVPAVERSQSE